MKIATALFASLLAVGSLPAASFEVLPLGDIKPVGWMKNQLTRDITTGYISAYDRIQPSLGRNFFGPVKQREYVIDARGQKQTRPAGWWPGEHEGYFAEAVVRSAFLTGHEPWQAKARKIIDNVIAHQDVDGYIGVYDRECRVDRHRFSDGDLWTQSRMQVAILAFYECTGERKYLDAVCKAADYNLSRLSDPGKNYFGQGLSLGLMYVDVLEWLHRLTRDERYVKFAFKLYDDYNRAPEVMRHSDVRLVRLLDREERFLGHSVHVVDKLRVMFWLASRSDDPRYREAVDNIFHKLGQSLTPSGAIVTDLKIHESVAGNFGSPVLPYEFCSTTELLASYASGFQKFGMAHLGDAAENLAFNAGQGARFPDGKAIAYCAKDNRTSATFNDAPKGEGFRYQYAACHSVACCNLEAAKLMPYYVSNSWMKTADGGTLVAFLYGPTEVDTKINGVRVRLTETTLYPFENQVTLRLEPAAPTKFDLLLRNPAWSRNTRVTAAGATISRERGFIRVTKNWAKGDVITITFDDRIEVEHSQNNELHVKKGALIYALPLAGRLQATKEFETGTLANYDVTLAEEGDRTKYDDYRIVMTGKKDATLSTVEGNFSDAGTLVRVIEPGSQLFFLKEYVHTGNHEMKGTLDAAMFTYRRNPEASAEYPFDRPFGHIVGRFGFRGQIVEDTLVPMGSTLLRRVSFPAER